MDNGNLSTTRYYISNNRTFLLASIGKEFYYLTSRTQKWLKDQRAERLVSNDSPDAERADIKDVRQLVGEWYPVELVDQLVSFYFF